MRERRKIDECEGEDLEGKSVGEKGGDICMLHAWDAELNRVRFSSCESIDGNVCSSTIWHKKSTLDNCAFSEGDDRLHQVKRQQKI